MALRAMLDNDHRMSRGSNSDERKHRPYTARKLRTRLRTELQTTLMPARIGLAQPSRRLPIAAILRSAATIASQ